MKMLLTRARLLGVGIRPITLEDFYEYCNRDGIRVIWSDEKFPFYFSIRGVPFITLPKKLTGPKLLFAALHEFAHHKLTPGTTALFGGELTRDEFEADVWALVAMMPSCELLDDSDDAYDLWRQRMTVEMLRD